MLNFLRYGWPRRALLMLWPHLPGSIGDRLLNFLYPDDLTNAVWLPKSQVEVEHDGGQERFVTVTLPEWLAKEKGLI